jgi:hypothetical protein
MRSARQVISTTAGLAGLSAVAAVHFRLATPEQIGMAAAVVAGGITVFTSWVAAQKSISTDKKVDNITILVDGRYGDVLRELSDVRGILAQRSGAPHDIARAASALAEADDQDAKVARVETKTVREP